MSTAGQQPTSEQEEMAPPITSPGAASSRTTTLRDVAREAGVHVSTVSRVLSGRASEGRITLETQQRVRDAAERLGYRRNTLARALRTGRTLVVGMIVPDIANLYVAGITAAAERALAAHGYSLLLASTEDDLGKARSQVWAMLGSQAEGLLYGVARLEDPVLEAVLESGTPVVLFNRASPTAGVSSVLVDDEAGIHRAVRHLFELGHRRIGHVAGPPDISSGRARRAAFSEAMAEVGAEGEWVSAERQTEEEGERVAGVLLDRHPTVTAIVAANDRLALGAVDAARARGLRCPEDLSVVGFNDMPYAGRFSPPLTTLHVSQEELGERAASLLVAAMQDPGRDPEVERIAPRLVVRGSTAPARALD